MIKALIKLTCDIFKSGLWIPVGGLYAVHLVGLPHIPAAAGLLMML